MAKFYGDNKLAQQLLYVLFLFWMGVWQQVHIHREYVWEQICNSNTKPFD